MSGGGPEASGASTGEVTQAPGRDWSALIGRGVITLVTLAGFAWLLDLPLLGFDAWPLVAAARWEGAGDLQRLLTAELMEGRYPTDTSTVPSSTCPSPSTARCTASTRAATT